MERRCFRYFTLADFREEEAFLARMHREGWRFVRVGGIGLYHFARCAPEEYVYRLDFRPETGDEAAYLRMFEDYGWEFLQNFNHGWYYFRRRKAEDGEEEIFSDAASRVEMLRRVCRRFALCLALLALLPLYWFWLVRGTPAALPVGVCYLGLVLALAAWLTSIFHKLRRLAREAEHPLPDGR